MKYLPLFHDLANKPVLVIGGGTIAKRKASLLDRAGAQIHVVAPEVFPELQATCEAAGGSVQRRVYQDGDVDGMTLVIAATENLPVNRQVSEHAQAAGIPVNVVDQPDLCTFVFPSIVDRSPLLVAVSSAGASPVLARLLRAKIETIIPSAYGFLAEWMGRLRPRVKAAIPDIDRRRHFWEQVIDGPIAEQVLSGNQDRAQPLFDHALATAENDECVGEVYLVGAGPGDPDLLTFKALRLMQRADVVLYDRLVSEAILRLTRVDAERIYVGKKRDYHSLPQGEINQLLTDLAKQGKRVLRLKGGDPFIFGRGGEEIETLAEQGVAFQVVPGITAAAGCASYTGIPLTHRDHAQSVRFVTGHLKDGSCNLPWAELVHDQQTIVFYMGLKGLPVICEKLVEHGKDPQTPIALVERGTLPQQALHIGTLTSIVEDIADKEIHAPTLLIVGSVVDLHAKLDWYQGTLV